MTPMTCPRYAFRCAEFVLAVYRDRIELDDRGGPRPQPRTYPLSDVTAVRSTPDGQLVFDLVTGGEIRCTLDAATAAVRELVAGLL